MQADLKADGRPTCTRPHSALTRPSINSQQSATTKDSCSLRKLPRTSRCRRSYCSPHTTAALQAGNDEHLHLEETRLQRDANTTAMPPRREMRADGRSTAMHQEKLSNTKTVGTKWGGARSQDAGGEVPDDVLAMHEVELTRAFANRAARTRQKPLTSPASACRYCNTCHKIDKYITETHT